MANEKLTCFLIDDDKMSLKILKSLIDKTESLQLIGMFEHPIEAFNALSKQEVDLLFLDVEMPELNGLELLKTIEQKPQIILTTSKPQYAVDAFDYEVADFLLKPIENYARFLIAVRKAKMNHENAQTLTEGKSKSAHFNQIFIKVDSLLINYNLHQILWIEASGDYVKIITDQKPLIVHSKLSTVEARLPAKDFVRIHRSFIVRVDKIKNIDNSNLQVGNNIIPISNTYKSNLMNKIKTLN